MAKEGLAALELAVPGMEREVAGLEEDLSAASTNYTAAKASAVTSAQIILKVHKPIFKTMSNKEICTFMGTLESSNNVEAQPEGFSNTFNKAVLDPMVQCSLMDDVFFLIRPL